MAYNPDFAYDPKQDEEEEKEVQEELEMWREDSHRETIRQEALERKSK